MPEDVAHFDKKPRVSDPTPTNPIVIKDTTKEPIKDTTKDAN